MAHFRKLLLAIDLSPLSESLLRRVQQVCGDEMDHLYVVHVLTHGLHDVDVRAEGNHDNPHAQRMQDHKALRIRELLHKANLQIPSDRIFLVHGEPASEIKKMANKIQADLVIVGSHVKENDWMQLPGATTNCVIQGISSDVMAVKV
ncbi:MAG: universal stress protein [Proteobacteria bacterium]|nr:universal stress protein [Pseudomonadota bacterium]MDA0929368.1 universal stress protein [Pseudomonadota bacterium]